MAKPLIIKPLPFKESRWSVAKEVVGDAIKVYAKGSGVYLVKEISLTNRPLTYVREPGFIRRLFGDTIEKRIEKAERKAQRVCDEQNKLIDTEKYIYSLS